MTYQLVQSDQAPQIQAVLKRADDNSLSTLRAAVVH